MSDDNKRSVRGTARLLHRYIGYFLIGFTVVYSLSGIILVYRDTDFLKRESRVERKVAPNLSANELGRALHVRELKVTKEEGDTVFFEGGEYNKPTGIAVYTGKSLPLLIEKCSRLHKSASGSPTHWIAVVFGISLFFLAVSSFWMYTPGTRHFWKNIGVAAAGFVAAIAVLIAC